MEEQLPSGILLFFAISFFLTAPFVFFSGGEGINSLSVVLGLAFVALGGIFIWLVYYDVGEQQVRLPATMANVATEPLVEDTTKEITSAPEQVDQTQVRRPSYTNYCIEKQFADSTQGLDREQAINYETQIINESVARGVDPRTVLAERGFPC